MLVREARSTFCDRRRDALAMPQFSLRRLIWTVHFVERSVRSLVFVVSQTRASYMISAANSVAPGSLRFHRRKTLNKLNRRRQRGR